jgi:type IV pilus assembly protein PilO
MDLAAINDLDFSESGEWPVIAKVIAIVFLCVLVWAGGYYFIIQDKQAQLSSLEQQEATLKQTFEIKQAKAVNLEAYKKQMAEMRIEFKSMLEQLPKTSEVADLLVDISRTGLMNGLEFELFRPGNERPADFYAELPIEMKVTGTYHQFGKFVSGVAALPRIVTMHDFSMGPMNDKTGKMTMQITAKTYRYLDERSK